MWFLQSSNGCLTQERLGIGCQRVHTPGCSGSFQTAAKGLEESWGAAGLQAALKPEKVGSNIREELASESEGSRQTEKGSFFLVLLCGLPPEVLPILRVGLPASDNLIKKVTRRSAQQLGFQLFLDQVALTTKISHHSQAALAHGFPVS